MKAGLLESQTEHAINGLGRIAASLVVGSDDVADLALLVLGADPPEADVANQGPGSLQDGGKAQAAMLVVDRDQLLRTLDELGNLIARPRLGIEIARHLWRPIHGEERVGVVIGERAKEQTLGVEWERQGRHFGILRAPCG